MPTTPAISVGLRGSNSSSALYTAYSSGLRPAPSMADTSSDRTRWLAANRSNRSDERERWPAIDRSYVATHDGPLLGFGRMAQSNGPLSSRDAATAAALRERFGFLHDVVLDMERRVPYAAALARTRTGLRLGLRDAEQSADRMDPQEGIVLTASNGHQLEEASTDLTDVDAVRRLADDLVERAL